MRSRYVIIAEELTREERAALTQAIRDDGAKWWHHLQDSWLILDPRGRPIEWWTPRIRDVLSNSLGSFLVISVGDDGGELGGSVPEKGAQWLARTWPK